YRDDDRREPADPCPERAGTGVREKPADSASELTCPPQAVHVSGRQPAAFSGYNRRLPLPHLTGHSRLDASVDASGWLHCPAITPGGNQKEFQCVIMKSCS